MDMDVEVETGEAVNVGLMLFLVPSWCGLHVHLGT